jgi:4'-phosphopantetheinyl transferase
MSDHWTPLGGNDDRRPASIPALAERAVHVWRVALHDEARVEASRRLLSPEEHARAHRLHDAAQRRRFVIAHAALRALLAGYLDAAPSAITYVLGAHGKPALAARDGVRSGVEFNLSHSEDIALVAVARGQPVGVDVQHWSESVEHLRLADRFFSLREREALRALTHEAEQVAGAFFAAWTRKEAYVKATGYGIARGLHHFDVTLAPGEHARLLADRLDPDAPERWSMTALEPAPRYSAAVVVASPLRDVERFAL